MAFPDAERAGQALTELAEAIGMSVGINAVVFASTEDECVVGVAIKESELGAVAAQLRLIADDLEAKYAAELN